MYKIANDIIAVIMIIAGIVWLVSAYGIYNNATTIYHQSLSSNYFIISVILICSGFILSALGAICQLLYKTEKRIITSITYSNKEKEQVINKKDSKPCPNCQGSIAVDAIKQGDNTCPHCNNIFIAE